MARKSTTTTVGTPAVRAWAAGRDEYAGAKFLTPREGESAARGRVPNAVIEAYQKDTGNTVATGHKAESTVELSVTRKDKRGRNYTRKVQVSQSQARELAGEAAGKRGALSKVALEAAAEAYAAQA